MVSDAEELQFCHLELCWLGNESNSDIPTGCDKAIDPIPASSGRSLGMQEAIRYHVLGLLACFAYMQGC